MAHPAITCADGIRASNTAKHRLVLNDHPSANIPRRLTSDRAPNSSEAAKRNQRSLEAELREKLRLHRPRTQAEIDTSLKRLAEIRAMTPDVLQTPSEVLVREMRDSDGFRDR